MSLFVYHPRVDDVAGHSLDFFRMLLAREKQNLAWAKKNLEQTHENYETAGGNTWNWGSVTGPAEDAHSMILKIYNAALKKFEWEKKRSYARSFPKPHPLSFPRPWIDNQKEWLMNFRQNNPLLKSEQND